jgi:hypothetical protein
MPTTEQYAKRGRAILRDLKREDECILNRSKCQSGLGALSVMFQKYNIEIKTLRALPKLNEFQERRLANLEKKVADLRCTLERSGVLQKTR